MFRAAYHKNKILICKVCKLHKSVPQHHNKDMVWVLNGSFRKTEYLTCIICNQRIEIPIHCDLPMFYSEDNGYLDMPDFTRIDFKQKYFTNKEK